MKVKNGMLFENEETNIFVRYVENGTVSYIEGFSPAAIHNIQKIPIENFIKYLKDYDFIQNGYYL